MGQVSVTIAGRTYRVVCDDGQENHVAELGDYLDHRACELARVLGHVSEALLLTLAGLVIADELWDCRHALDEVTQERDQLTQALAETRREMEEIRLVTSRTGKDGAFARAVAEEEIAARIERLAERIETLAERLE